MQEREDRRVNPPGAVGTGRQNAEHLSPGLHPPLKCKYTTPTITSKIGSSSANPWPNIPTLRLSRDLIDLFNSKSSGLEVKQIHAYRIEQTTRPNVVDASFSFGD